MRYTILFTISLLCFFHSCQCNQDPGRIGPALGPEMQRFTVNIGQDTIIRCKGGMVLRFCPSTFICAQKQFVLEVQEVLNRGEAFLLGISTLASDGRVLETEGMVYLNAANSGGNVVSINPDCPIRLEIPVKGRRAGTKWFQGNISASGMTWVEIPGGLENQSDLTALETGQQLYQKLCADCHCADMRTNLALGNITHFRDKMWLREFTRNSQRLIASGDSLANCLWNSFKPTLMPPFPQLSDVQIDAIYQFIEEESGRLKVEIGKAHYDVCQSGNIDSISHDAVSNQTPVFSPPSNPYFAKISSFGWHNCDRFYDDTTAQLAVVKVYVPQADQYDEVLVGILFDKLNSNINLQNYETGQFETYRDWEIKIPHVPARIVAIGIKGKRWFKFEQQFTVGKSNIFTANMQSISEKELDAFIGTKEFIQPQIEAVKQQCPTEPS